MSSLISLATFGIVLLPGLVVRKGITPNDPQGKRQVSLGDLPPIGLRQNFFGSIVVRL